MGVPRSGLRYRLQLYRFVAPDSDKRRMASADATGLVFIVDDDPAVGVALQRLLDSVGLRSEAFVRADEFLSRMPSNVPSCLIADVRMPRMSGLELQKALHGELEMPVIILSAHVDVRQTVRAMRDGAVTVIAKPFNDQDLLDAVQTALDQDAERRQQKRDRARLAERYDTLTERQRAGDGARRDRPDEQGDCGEAGHVREDY